MGERQIAIDRKHTEVRSLTYQHTVVQCLTYKHTEVQCLKYQSPVSHFSSSRFTLSRFHFLYATKKDMQSSQVIDPSAQLHTNVKKVTFRVHMAAALPLTKHFSPLGWCFASPALVHIMSHRLCSTQPIIRLQPRTSPSLSTL